MAFFIAPNPVWLFRDVNGNPLRLGQLWFYRDIARDEPKDVFQDPGGVTPYDNPIILSDFGTVNSLIYFNDDELYYIEIYDQLHDITYTIEGFPLSGGGGGNPTISFNIDNLYANAQFRFFTNQTISTLPDDVIDVAYLWQFEKNNTTATDSIQYLLFNLGINDPVSTPIYYLRYETTSPGNNESIKDLFQTWQDVRTFEETEVSIGLEARRTQGNGDLSIVIEQNFGTGGAPSAPIITNVITFPLTPDWTKFTHTFTVPSVGGNTLGDDNNDFIRIRIRYPFNTTTTIDVTNMQFHTGDVVPVFPRVPFFLDKGKTASALLPLAEGPQDIGKAITVDTDLSFTLGATSFVGAIVALGYGIPDTPVPAGVYLCDGATYPTIDDLPLFSVIDHLWGYGDDVWIAEDFEDGSIIISHNIGEAVNSITMGVIDPGFTVTTYQTGSPGNAFFKTTSLTYEMTGTDLSRTFNVQALEKGIVNRYFNPTLLDAGLADKGVYPQNTVGFSLLDNTVEFRGNDQMPFQANPVVRQITPPQSSYFVLSQPNGGTVFTFWYGVDGDNTAPVVPGTTLVQIPVLSTDNPEVVKVKTLGTMGGHEVEILEFTDANTVPPGSYFLIDTFDNGLYYVWFTINGAGADPNIGGRIGILCPLLATDVDTEVAEKVLECLRNAFFQVPDLRGQFLRGYDPEWVYDEEGSRGLGDVNRVGTFQYPENLDHDHNLIVVNTPNPAGENRLTKQVGVLVTETTGSRGTTESRPLNRAVSYVIQRF